MYGPCLSSIGGGQALTSPMRHSLGSLLHYQQADTTQALPQAINLYPALNFDYNKLYMILSRTKRLLLLSWCFNLPSRIQASF